MKSKKSKILCELREVDRSLKGTSQGSSIIKRFCKSAQKDLDQIMNTKDGRQNIKSLTGIKVRKIL